MQLWLSVLVQLQGESKVKEIETLFSPFSSLALSMLVNFPREKTGNNNMRIFLQAYFFYCVLNMFFREFPPQCYSFLPPMVRTSFLSWLDDDGCSWRWRLEPVLLGDST